MERASLILLAVVVGCGGAPQPVRMADATATGPTAPACAVGRFLPVLEDRIWVYDVEGDDPSSKGMFTTRMRRLGPTQAELRTGSQGRVLEYRPDGIVQPLAQTYVLKAPLSLGARWPGASGSEVLVAATDRTVQTAAGLFTGCVETVESASGEGARKTTTVYCPDVGIVELRVETRDRSRFERARLRSFGAPVDVGPPGVTR
jgi:hypothetical protein